MRRNYTIAEATRLYRGLANEAYTYFDIDLPIPRFEIIPMYQGLFGGIIFEPGYSERPAESIAATDFNMYDKVTVERVILNSFFLPFLYEDELISVLLHEMAHCVVGWEADHDDTWSRAAYELGAYDKPFIISRAAFAREIPWYGEYEYREVQAYHQQPSLGFIE